MAHGIRARTRDRWFRIGLMIYWPPQLQPPSLFVKARRTNDTLASFGHLATTNPNGALNWNSALNKYVAGRPLIIVPDADVAGRKCIDDLHNKLKDVAASFNVVTLPGLEFREKHGEDITDWIEKHIHSNDEFIELARKAPKYESSQSEQIEFPNNSGAAPLRYELLHDMQGPLTARPWMIKGIFAKGETSMWYGPPGALKLALPADATVAIANGEDWFDRKSKGNFGVIYFALERAVLCGAGFRRP
jgi:AAA domain